VAERPACKVRVPDLPDSPGSKYLSFAIANGLLVVPVALGESSQARLTMLYRSTDRRCRAGAPMENLAHSASFHSGEKSAPLKPGIKQLGGLNPLA
jgi:hypothetical protein